MEVKLLVLSNDSHRSNHLLINEWLRDIPGEWYSFCSQRERFLEARIRRKHQYDWYSRLDNFVDYMIYLTMCNGVNNRASAIIKRFPKVVKLFYNNKEWYVDQYYSRRLHYLANKVLLFYRQWSVHMYYLDRISIGFFNDELDIHLTWKYQPELYRLEKNMHKDRLVVYSSSALSELPRR